MYLFVLTNKVLLLLLLLRPSLLLSHDVGHDDVRRSGERLGVADGVDESLHGVVAAAAADGRNASFDTIAVIVRCRLAVLSQQQQRLVNNNLQ